ncbi:unnamed protein product [Phyllotreta striolata]|uniref:N-acetyltransferase domain-containing protein n=1 Tax=Phyllotreta striolata TaxID=444603 RepID=A0A9N9XRJ2_PHYSR|nr:unnamed protein product [Phyllotreta striolata]
MSLEVVPIHKHPKYLNDCCKLINQEWTRSEGARMHSLTQSTDKLPTSLILLKDKTVIGHVKLSIIPTVKTACFLESLVIDKALRGKGFGTVLMREAENFCRNLRLSTIFLSTRGQEEFYAKLGYIECMPVSIYGGSVSIVCNSLPKKPVENSTKNSNSIADSRISLPPPPPPPLPFKQNNPATEQKSPKTYMKKDI